MVTLHLVAKSYGRRPSEMVGIADEWAAYQLDVAVLLASLDEERGAGAKPRGKWSELVSR